MSISSAGSVPAVSFTGLESGLNTQQIISAYLSIDEAPLVDLQNQQSTDNTKIAAYQNLQTQLQAMQTAGDALAQPNAFAAAVKATSSDTAVAAATTTTGAGQGSTTFSVDQLAAADTLVSSGTVASTSDVVAAGSLLVASGTSGLGSSSLAGSGLAAGSHTIAVTQASSGASVTGTSALASLTTIASGSNTLSGTLDGSAFSFNLAAGSYTTSQVAAEIGTASGGVLVGTVNSAGQLVVSSAQQGSAASLQIGSGSANATLGLSAGASGTGTDGVITVDGHSNTVSSIATDGSTVVTLTSGSGGTITAQLAGSGLVVGSINADNVSLGNGSLASVVGAINAAGVGVTAQALQVGPSSYALEIASNQTGAANDVSISPAAFAGGALGTLTTSTAGQDAIVSLGGSGGYQIHSSSNTVTSLLPGVDISLQSVSAAPVTVSVSPDGQAAASQVQSFVDAANTVLSTIAADTAYNQQTNTAGPLNGDMSVQRIAQQILSTVGQSIGSASTFDSTTSGSAAGLSLGQDTINFDATTFAADFNANPTAVSKLFTQGGTFTPASGSPAAPSDVTLLYASDGTQPGSYSLSVSQSARQASDTGSAVFASGSTVGTATSYTVSVGSTSATYGVQAGATLGEVASGLDTAFAAAGLALSAQVVANGSGSSLQVTSAAYGSATSFQVSTSGTDALGLASATPFTGTDVAGTINGVAATGSGQVLTAPAADPTLAGMALQVQTVGITSPVTIGSYDYQPGVAQALAAVANAALAPGSGEVPVTLSSLKSTVSALGSQISIEQQLVVQQQAALTQQFTQLEQTLATLKSESQYLTSAFGTSSGSSLLSSLGGSGGSSSTSSSTSTTGG